ncbi:MAG: sulfatase-like hydrolase/transferase [Halioglobus sp.]
MGLSHFARFTASSFAHAAVTRLPANTALLLLLCLQTELGLTAERPNILVLMAEDMSARVAVFGDPVAVTPHLDALAKQGVRYPNTFTTAGVCAPSRAAHILGMHQMSTGTQHMRTSSRPAGGYKSVPPPQVRAYPELLRAAGYYTYTDHKLDYQFSGTLRGSGPFTIWSEEGSGTHWRNRADGQPFFGLVNFPVTHESGVFPPLGAWPHSVTHFVLQFLRWAQSPDVEVSRTVQASDVPLPPYYPDTETVRNDIARHYNNIIIMDAQVGALLAQLEADGLADNTIVVWTTDHGDGLPRAKRELYDSGIRVPMIIRWPESLRPHNMTAGSLDERLISLVDLAPTLLRVAGVEVPPYLHGRDFVRSEPRRYVYAARDRIDEVPDRQRAVRDQRYKYIRSWYPQLPGGHALAFRDNIPMMREMRALYERGNLNSEQKRWFEPPGNERLFDILADPYELQDLSQDPAHAATLQRLRDEVARWQREVGDWSELSEAEMVAKFMPRGEIEKTPVPKISVVSGVMELVNAVEGASMGYRLDGEPWRVYDRPVHLHSATRVQARAVRYGWEESDLVSMELP